MTNKAALAMLIGGLAVAGTSGAFAQSPTPTAPPAQDGKPMQPGMMMGGKDGMQSMKMDDHMMQQMARMMENCNKMMESKLQNPAVTPATPAPSEKQG
jgi:hypothetical protein